jgi:predicted dehydrogenase
VELEAFRDAVLGLDRRIVTIEDATHTVEVAEAMLRASETGQTQALT